MAKKIPARLDVSLAMVAIGAFAIYRNFVVTGIFLVGMGLFNITRWQQLKFLRQLPDLLRSNLDELDAVFAGMRWIGKESKIIANSIPEIYDYGKVCLRVVCRTDKDAWFIVWAELMENRTLEFRIESISEREVKSLLLHIDRKLCEQHFGKFVIA